MESIAIIDLGGQYCHLISRRLRDLGVASEIYGSTAEPQTLARHSGVILSGGPQSVYETDSPKIHQSAVDLNLPILGICYGHQLLAQMLGGKVERGTGEYGLAVLNVPASDGVFEGTPQTQRVWMSHSDRVTVLPSGCVKIAETDTCDNAAYADPRRGIYGVQFHPEVIHTEHGNRILKNFLRVCKLDVEEGTEIAIDPLVQKIASKVKNNSVFFLVSGGVDSTVAFVLCAKAIQRERILGLFVDTGFMRKGEKEELQRNLASIGLEDRLKIRDESKRFLSALNGVVDPEQKRQIIGRLFMDVQTDATKELGIDSESWLLGQGTIYPDTIESGGAFGRAAVIKTHHNRCAEVLELIQRGRVIEPLSEFYKDEVRRIGLSLGLDSKLTNRWPFPGPGLAIRIICTRSEGRAEKLDFDQKIVGAHGVSASYEAALLPIQSVGVQGDGRTYRRVVALRHLQQSVNYKELEQISTNLCNRMSLTNRIILLISGNTGSLLEARVQQKAMNAERLELLREADSIVRNCLDQEKRTDDVWQFPVVLIPVSFHEGESIILRPVNSEDGMTANFAHLPVDLIRRIADQIMQLNGVDAVFLDATNKPPATIEWE